MRPPAVRNALGEPLILNNAAGFSKMSRFDFFLLMFPPTQLTDMVRLTNDELVRRGKSNTTKGEILKLFGVMILITSFEFTSRASLWSTVATYKYRPAPCFGKTGMARQRFDDLLSALV